MVAVESSQTEADPEQLIAVKMSRHAAEELARACQWATHRATDEWDDTSLSAEKRHKAMVAYEWLSWGAHWMVHEEARTDA